MRSNGARLRPSGPLARLTLFSGSSCRPSWDLVPVRASGTRTAIGRTAGRATMRDIGACREHQTTRPRLASQPRRLGACTAWPTRPVRITAISDSFASLALQRGVGPRHSPARIANRCALVEEQQSQFGGAGIGMRGGHEPHDHFDPGQIAPRPGSFSASRTPAGRRSGPPEQSGPAFRVTSTAHGRPPDRPPDEAELDIRRAAEHRAARPASATLWTSLSPTAPAAIPRESERRQPNRRQHELRKSEPDHDAIPLLHQQASLTNGEGAIANSNDRVRW